MNSDFIRCKHYENLNTGKVNTMKDQHFYRLIIGLLISILIVQGFATEPLRLDPGPHLFIDNYLIADQYFLSRTVNQPIKIPEPVVTGGVDGDQNFQPYMSVIRDEKSGLFRMWYNTPENISQSHIGYIESEDGIHWKRPHRVLGDPQEIKFNVSVVDRGTLYAKPEERFVLGFYHEDGMKIAVSPDGLEWKMLTEKTVVKHNQDVNSLCWDPIRKQFLMVGQMKLLMKPDWKEKRRIPHQTVSKDLLNWEPIWPILMPKIGAPIEKGETQYYAMSGIKARGDLLIGLVKILRDDLNATAGKTAKEMGDMKRKAAGIGYTVLAWSRDGRTWQRDHEVFIPQNPLPGSWDHANAWGGDQLVVGDKTFLYYAGYARGHKVERFKERHIGLARMPRDRYVAREADLNMGRLVTKALRLNGSQITVNAYVEGKMRIRLVDINGDTIEGYDWVDISGDAVDHPVPWKQNLKSLNEKNVQIEFQLQDAQIFGFDLRE
jgi:hypothetical protein